MRALSIRQPYAEETLLGLKKIEYRNGRVLDPLIGEKFYIYAARKWPAAKDIKRFCKRRWEKGTLPTGVLVGTARISKCTPVHPSSVSLHPFRYKWHLMDVKRLKRPLRPRKHPQPSWFNPF